MALNFNWEMLLEPSLFTEDPWWLYILYGAGWTIGLAVSAFALALAVGIVIGTLRTVENRFVRGFCEAWIELFRNIPLIVQIFLWYFVLPELIAPYKEWMISAPPVASQFLSAFLCLGLFTSSRVAEQVRAGIVSIPRGLFSAAKALGLRATQSYAHVVLPMALRIVLPPLTSEAMNLIKNTAVALTIGLPELTMRANEMGENTFEFFAAYLWATVLYIAISLSAGRLMAALERKSAIPGFIAAR